MMKTVFSLSVLVTIFALCFAALADDVFVAETEVSVKDAHEVPLLDALITKVTTNTQDVCCCGCVYYAQHCLCPQNDAATDGSDATVSVCNAGCTEDGAKMCLCPLEKAVDGGDATDTTLGGPTCSQPGCYWDGTTCACSQVQCPPGCVRDITGQCSCNSAVVVQAQDPQVEDGANDDVTVEAARPAPANCQNIPICTWDGQSCVCSIPAAKDNGVKVSIKHDTIDALHKFSKKVDKALTDMALHKIVKVAHRVVEKKLEKASH